jgi:hypothetical protein
MTANITKDVGYYRSLLESVEESVDTHQNLYNKIMEIRSHASVGLEHPDRMGTALEAIKNIASELLDLVKNQVSDEGQDDFVSEDPSQSQP